MERKEDLRIQKTYDALMAAYQELLTEKTFEELTVRELCGRAKIRTATFYSHFPDKYDCFASLARRIRQDFLLRSELTASRMEPENYISSVIRDGLDFLEKNEAFICAAETNPILAPPCT